MPIQAGESVTAGRLNRLRPVPYTATATGDLTVTGTTTNIPGCAITFTVESAGARVLVEGTANFVVGGTALTAGSFSSAQLRLDGVNQAGFARWGSSVADSMGTPSGTWDITGVAAGSHTITLAAARTSAGVGTVTAVAAHSKLVIWVYEAL